MAPILSNNYADRLYAMLFVNTGFVMNVVFRGMKPFVPEVTLSKFRFLGGSGYTPALLEMIDED